MAVNWAWDGGPLHQAQCPAAYLAGLKCECLEGGPEFSHVVPAWQEHEASTDCPCGPSVGGYDRDGDPVWVHEVFQ